MIPSLKAAISSSSQVRSVCGDDPGWCGTPIMQAHLPSSPRIFLGVCSCLVSAMPLPVVPGTWITLSILGWPELISRWICSSIPLHRSCVGSVNREFMSSPSVRCSARPLLVWCIILGGNHKLGRADYAESVPLVLMVSLRRQVRPRSVCRADPCVLALLSIRRSALTVFRVRTSCTAASAKMSRSSRGSSALCGCGVSLAWSLAQ